MIPTKPDLTISDPQVRARLAHAAEYLTELRDEQFTMKYYSRTENEPAQVLTTLDDHCGCIIGHIPRIAPEWTQAFTDEHGPPMWDELAAAFIGRERLDDDISEDPLYTWLFDTEWHWVDDTPRGAIGRIRIALAHGVPPAFARTRHLEPVLYAHENPDAPATRPANEPEHTPLPGIGHQLGTSDGSCGPALNA